MPRIVNAFENKSRSFAIYGPAGTGKTRLAACAMRGNPEKWGRKAAYIAIDPSSANLDSVLPHDKCNLVPFVLGNEEGKSYDPYQEVIEISSMLRKDAQGCDTVILDTATILARDILQAIANSGKFSDKHVMIETKGEGKLAMAMPGDYGATQQAMFNIFRAFEKLPLNFICLFHEGLFESDDPQIRPYVGPATAGKGAINGVAAWFNTLVRTEVKISGIGSSKKTEYLVHTEQSGIYLAKLRTSSIENVPSVISLDKDPVKFWENV